MIFVFRYGAKAAELPLAQKNILAYCEVNLNKMMVPGSVSHHFHLHIHAQA